jgi:hypothetical protein
MWVRKLLTIVTVVVGVLIGDFLAAGPAGAVSSGRAVQADTFRLMNITTNLCAGPSSRPETSGTVVQRLCSTGVPGVVWRAEPLPAATFVHLVNESSGQCMDLADVVGDAIPVVLAPCSPELASQQWQFVTSGVPGRLRIVNGALGKCLQIESDSAPVNAPIQVSTCLFAARRQVWQGPTVG